MSFPAKFARSAVLAIGLAAVSLPAAAQVTQGQKFGDWIVRCERPVGAANEQCILFQVVNRRDQQTNQTQRVLLTNIGYVGPEKQPIISFAMPLGLYLPAGVKIQVDKQTPIEATVETCIQTGCRATLSLSAAAVGQLKRGNAATFTIQNLRRQNITLPISLKGITAGLDALSKQQ